jgi:hypothetical protein
MIPATRINSRQKSTTSKHHEETKKQVRSRFGLPNHIRDRFDLCLCDLACGHGVGQYQASSRAEPFGIQFAGNPRNAHPR